MRNRALHDSLRDFALEAAALLTDELRAGEELEFEVGGSAHPPDKGRRGGPTLYRYEPLTARFIGERWSRLRDLPTRQAAADALGAGASAYLRVNGMPGEQAEPALQAMLERLYEDATSFAFPEERFERVYREVEETLFHDTVRATIVAPLPGLVLEPARVELGDCLALVRGDAADAPHEALWPEEASAEPAALCVLERDVPADQPLPVDEAAERFRELVTGLRLFKSGGVTLAPVGWRRTSEGRWQPVDVGGAGWARGEAWMLLGEEGDELRAFLEAIEHPPRGSPAAWALARFDTGCARAYETEALSDYLLALRALLGATGEAGRASLALRLAALCAEEGERRALQRRVELAVTLERYVMEGGGGELQQRIGAESPRLLVAEMERHLRALLRDLLCGYLHPDLKGTADDILLESSDPIHIEARDLRVPATATARRQEAATDEIDAIDASAIQARRFRKAEPHGEPSAEPERPPDRPTAAAPDQPELEGVTPSADWGWDDPEDYSAPV